MKRARAGAAAVVLIAALAVMVPAGAGAPEGAGNGTAAYWTAARMAAATPRDLVIDERGLAYLRRADGTLAPHGHGTGQLWASPAPTSRPTPAGKPSGGGSTDTTSPDISDMDPSGGAIGASHVFSAVVVDSGSGVRSVSFVVWRQGSTQTQSFSASLNGGRWTAALQGFTDGAWQWRVIAKDNARRGGNTATSPDVAFTVDTSGGGGTGGGDSPVTNAPWPTSGAGTVQTAAGRIYFEMPASFPFTGWDGYVCSGTVATDATGSRSVILTAAHCVYDDVNKVFARNVLFIPNQDATTGTRTDSNCANDPLGCWAPSFGVVDNDWASRTFPANIPWDYAYYVVPDTGAHTQGISAASDVLDSAAGNLTVQFSDPNPSGFTHALGYSYSEDPNFMYCAENLATEGSYGDWWLGKCGLSGGASGGPWMQPVNGGSGPIISVNSWGYSNQSGMGGPKLAGSSASCVFGAAKTTSFGSVTNRGIIAPGC